MAEQEKKRLIQQLDEARDTMRGVLEKVDLEAEIYPGWTAKHLLAHIAGWDEAVTISLRAYHADGGFQIPEFRSIDDYNAHSVATRQDLQYEQIRAEWELARDDLKAALEEMPLEKFGGELLFPWARRGTISQIVEVLTHHEREHAEDLAGRGAE